MILDIKNIIQQENWKIKQLNKTKQNKILQMTITFIYSSKV